MYLRFSGESKNLWSEVEPGVWSKLLLMWAVGTAVGASVCISTQFSLPSYRENPLDQINKIHRPTPGVGHFLVTSATLRHNDKLLRLTGGAPFCTSPNQGLLVQSARNDGLKSAEQGFRRPRCRKPSSQEHRYETYLTCGGLYKDCADRGLRIVYTLPPP